VNPNVKIMKGEKIGVRFLTCNTSKVRGSMLEFLDGDYDA
jgi:hypothetical protein